MNTSDSVVNLIGPWTDTLQELGIVAKDNTGHHGTYATINSVLSTIKPILLAHGMAVQQYTEPAEPGSVIIRTRVWHDSGEWIEDSGLRMPAPNDPQKVGSSITYGRRYALLTFFALGTADDDGHDGADGIRGDEADRRAFEDRRQRARDVFEEIRAMDDDGKAALKEWAKNAPEAHKVTVDAMSVDSVWLEQVENWMDERGAS